MSDIDLGQKLEDEFNNLKKELKKPNILIAGGTGVGKSSIINLIFGEDIASVGVGKPITKHLDVFESDNTDVRIYDTKGYEIKKHGDEEFFRKVVELPKLTGRPEDAVHLIWYCISTISGRVTEYDLNAIKKFADSNIPVAVLMTKTDKASEEDIKELEKIITDNFENIPVFETSINMPIYNHTDELIEWSINNLAEPLRMAFIRSQKSDLKTKWKKAHIMIAEHATGAFAVGFTPIPMSDAPILIANELGLLARILYLYDLGSLNDTLKQAGLGAAFTALLSAGGKAAVGALLKLIPGVGTVLGGAISGGVGAAITFAFGEATSGVGYQVSKARLNGNKVLADDMIANLGKIIIEEATKAIKSGKKSKDDYNFDDWQ